MRNDAHPRFHPGAFRAARDVLLANSGDYAAAVAAFAWPALDDFNWALDWFDVIAAEHPDRLALRVVGDDGSDEAVSYAAMAARSAQVANWLRGLGVRRGDHVLLMLGNIVPLWEIMLAAMKLGAVVIPASTLLQPADLADRISRGSVRHVIAEVAQVPKFAGIAGEWTRVAVGAQAPASTWPSSKGGWHAYADSAAAAAAFTPDGPTRAGRPAAALLHLGDHLPAEAGRPHPRQLPGRPPVHHVLDRHQARRRAPEHLLARLGQARLVEPVRPVERAGHDLDPEPEPVQRRRDAQGPRRLRASPRSARRPPCGGC